MSQRLTSISRRRLITVAAAAAGCACLPGVARVEGPRTVTWNGIALGAPAKLILQCFDEQQGRQAIAACLSEIARLEAIFSLHRSDSALVRLNESGRLDDAPIDLRKLLSEALALAARTDGAFDPTIQPLWQYMSQGGPDDPKESDRVRRLVGWRNVHIDGGTVRLSKPGMALSLNGIAQGYITDKVGELLRQFEFQHVLVDMGEQLALGPKWDGTAWSIGVSDPARPGALIETFSLCEGAVSTSSNFGSAADCDRVPHIIDPRTGEPANHWASVTVVADRATESDGLSTALCVLPSDAWRVAVAGEVKIFAISRHDGTGLWLS